MNNKLKTIIVFFFLLNSISIWVYWAIYLRDFDNNNLEFTQSLSSFMVTHITSEYTTGIATLVACTLLLVKSKAFNIIWNFAIGMHFYAALQATGWAFSSGMYQVFSLMLFNIILILSYLVISIYYLKKRNNNRL